VLLLEILARPIFLANDKTDNSPRRALYPPYGAGFFRAEESAYEKLSRVDRADFGCNRSRAARSVGFTYFGRRSCHFFACDEFGCDYVIVDRKRPKGPWRHQTPVLPGTLR
jgi:hypothetical protein